MQNSSHGTMQNDTTPVRGHGAASKRKRLGRPTGNINQRENILDAAEVDFSQRGYAGTSLKDVAALCGVTQALITYYFGTKQQLFEQVFLRRAAVVSAERVQRLNDLGFDIGEMSIQATADGTKVSIQPKVVDSGHHQRRLLRLTGLDVEENQARRLLNDLDEFRARISRLGDDEGASAHFYARADNLADYLQLVSSRLGSLSQRLSASVGQMRIGDAGADQPASASTSALAAPARSQLVKTPWTKIDDNFYEARGYTWALLEQLKAMQHDFGPILRSKHADVSLQQVIRELEEAQRPLHSPMVLNGSPFGFFANHSLVMANYVSRANAAIIDLRELLKRG